MRNFKNLEIWKRSHQLTLRIYRLTQSFPKPEQFGLTSQLRRATSSVPINIAEGCGRFSPNEFKRFLAYASGSLSEVEYIITLTYELHYIAETDFRIIDKEINEIKKMIRAFYNKLN